MLNTVHTIVLLLGVGLTLITVLFVFGIRGLYLRNGNASDDAEPEKSTVPHRGSAAESRPVGDTTAKRVSPSLKDTWIVRVAKGPRTKKYDTAGGGRVVVTPPMGDDTNEDVLRALEDATQQVRTYLKNRNRAA